MAQKLVPNRCAILKQISAPILTIFGPQNETKNRSKIGLGAKREPRSPRQPPGGPQEPPRRPSGSPQEAPKRPQGSPQEGPESPEADPQDHEPQADEATSPLAH